MRIKSPLEFRNSLSELSNSSSKLFSNGNLSENPPADNDNRREEDDHPADTAHDSDALRLFLIARGTSPVIPNNPTRKRAHPFDRQAYRLRNAIERVFCRLKDWRRIATRYDKLARNFLSALCFVAMLAYWL